MNIFSNLSLNEKSCKRLKFRYDLFKAKQSINDLSKTLESFDTNLTKINPVIQGNRAVLENIKQLNVGKANGFKKGIGLLKNLSSKVNILSKGNSNKQFSLMEEYTKLGSALVNSKVSRTSCRDIVIRHSDKKDMTRLTSHQKIPGIKFGGNNTNNGEKSHNDRDGDSYLRTNTENKLFISNYSNWNTLPSKEEESENKMTRDTNKSATMYTKISLNNFKHPSPRKNMLKIVKNICDDNHRKLDSTFITMHERIERLDDKVRHHNPKNVKLRKNIEVLKDAVNIKKNRDKKYNAQSPFLLNNLNANEMMNNKSLLLNYVIEKKMNPNSITNLGLLKEKSSQEKHIATRLRCKDNNVKINLLVREINLKHSLISKHVTQIKSNK